MDRLESRTKESVEKIPCCTRSFRGSDAPYSVVRWPIVHRMSWNQLIGRSERRTANDHQRSEPDRANGIRARPDEPETWQERSIQSTLNKKSRTTQSPFFLPRGGDKHDFETPTGNVSVLKSLYCPIDLSSIRKWSSEYCQELNELTEQFQTAQSERNSAEERLKDLEASYGIISCPQPLPRFLALCPLDSFRALCVPSDANLWKFCRTTVSKSKSTTNWAQSRRKLPNSTLWARARFSPLSLHGGLPYCRFLGFQWSQMSQFGVASGRVSGREILILRKI